MPKNVCQTNDSNNLASCHLSSRIGPTTHGARRNFTRTNNRTAAESTISWASEPSVLHRTPNIVMIVLDDVGYAEFGCYGSDIETPALDSLASDGLRYAKFHVTPLCSPTRTCLLTGRNHYSVGMGRVAEMVNRFPNTRGFASREAANLAEMLRPHGYQTLAAGKWHLGSIHETSPAGPYDHRPLQRGLDRFHGFMPGETNQWNPELITGTSASSRRSGGLSPVGGHRGSVLQVAAAVGVSRSRSTLLSLRRIRRRPLFPSRACQLREQVQGQIRRRLGRGPRENPSAAKGLRPAA